MITPGSTGALIQMSAVLAVQIFVVAYVALYKPSADRIMTLLVGTQFALEAGQTGLLLASNVWDLPNLQLVSLALSICSVLTPVFHRGYEVFVVTFIQLWHDGKCTPKAALFALVGLIVLIPSTILRVMGVESNGDDRITTHGSDDAQKLLMRQANQALAMEVERTGEVLFANAALLAQRDASFLESRAAKRLQRNFRRRHGYKYAGPCDDDPPPQPSQLPFPLRFPSLRY